MLLSWPNYTAFSPGRFHFNLWPCDRLVEPLQVWATKSWAAIYIFETFCQDQSLKWSMVPPSPIGLHLTTTLVERDTPAVVTQNKAKHIVCFDHVAVFALWQHQTAAVTSDIITGVSWPFLDGSMPQSSGKQLWQMEWRIWRIADASFS